MSLAVVIAIWSVSAVVSLPGLAVSPIMGDLNKIFPHVSNLEIQMLTSIPSVLIIPFILLSGRLSVARNKIALLRAGLAIFFISGVACLFARTMTQLIAVSCILGIGAGIVIPLSTGLVVDYFTSDFRVRPVGHKLRREQPDTGIGYGIHGLPRRRRLAPSVSQYIRFPS